MGLNIIVLRNYSFDYCVSLINSTDQVFDFWLNENLN